MPALHEHALSGAVQTAADPLEVLSAARSTDALDALVRSRVAERASTGVLFLATCFFLSSIFEVAYERSRLVPITLFGVGFTALGMVALAAIRARPRWSVAALVLCANLIGIGLSAYHVVVRGAAEGLALVLTGLITTITVLYPWGWRRQGIAILGAVVSFPLAIALGSVSTMPPRTLMAFLGVASLMSLFGAEIVHGYLRSDFRLTSALREREARLQSYFDQALIGMAILAPNRRWREVNGELCRMLGYAREELVGHGFG
jgi:PAS domain-containing protein